MDGSFDFQGDVHSMEGEESSSDEDDGDRPSRVDQANDPLGCLQPTPVPSSSLSGHVPENGGLCGNYEYFSDDSSSSQFMVLDSKKRVKEDAELYSLRVGVQFGEGAFNLILSLIPSGYQKALEVMRFPASRDKGVNLLHRVSVMKHPASPLASIMLLYYHTVIMGLLPYSSEHAREAHELLEKIPVEWKASSLFRILMSRLERYERNLLSAILLVQLSPHNPFTIKGNGSMRKLRSLALDELGWCFLLQGRFYDAANCFGTLLQESIFFKSHYAFLQSSCLWEASENAHVQAGQLLNELPMLIAAKKQQQLTPIEQYACQVSSKFVACNQAPLFSALELAAMYNGFQFMDRASLELHERAVEEVLQARTQIHKTAQSTTQENGMESIVGRNLDSFTSGQGVLKPMLHYEHKWTRSSKMISRFLLGVCQKNLGEIQKADDNFRYVIENLETYCSNIVPYSCYELGSMLLQQDASSPEGFKLMEQSLSYPAHEFQGRLKFVVGELMRMHGTTASSTPEESIDQGITTGSLRRVSEQFEGKFSLQDTS